MTHARGPAVLAAMTLAAFAAAALGGAAHAQQPPLPDWSGWWGLEGPLQLEMIARGQMPPLKPEFLARLRGGRTSDDGGVRDLYCRPATFAGYSGGFVENVEFLLTPDRVTLLNESGLVRRIYTDGRALPADVEASFTGLSVGRWEGETLVVETAGIDPAALYPQPSAVAFPVGRDVKIVERISLLDADSLQFEITMTAPEILTAVDKRTRVYSRVPKRTAAQISFCSDHDRAVDPTTGKQRFDMTPPADLPPPPAP